MKADLPEGFRLQVHERVESTNSLALEAGRAGDPGRLWIVGREQTGGRGRRGRTWVSPPGNLYASLLLVDPAEPGVGGSISFVAAVAVDRALIDLVGPGALPRIALKWPNDVLCDGRKVAGILVEGEEISGRAIAAVGIGVNCRWHPPIAGDLPAGDFASLGLDVSPEALFPRLAQRMAEALAEWERGRNFGSIRQEWLARAVGVGAGVRVATAGAEVVGKLESIDSVGRMVLRLSDGTQKAISAGDATIRFAGEAR